MENLTPTDFFIILTEHFFLPFLPWSCTKFKGQTKDKKEKKFGQNVFFIFSWNDVPPAVCGLILGNFRLFRRVLFVVNLIYDCKTSIWTSACFGFWTPQYNMDLNLLPLAIILSTYHYSYRHPILTYLISHNQICPYHTHYDLLRLVIAGFVFAMLPTQVGTFKTFHK